VTAGNGSLLTVVAPSFAPQVSGSTILLANLLTGYLSRVDAISGWEPGVRSDAAFRSPCPVHHVPLSRRLARVHAALRRRSPEVLCRLLQPAIQNRLRESETSVVMGTLPCDAYLVAGFRAARALRLPFYAHMHDLWAENMGPDGPVRRFADAWEPTILREATRVLCMTEAMQEHYEKKYGIATDLLPHCVSDVELSRALGGIRPARTDQAVVVLFVGVVSPAMNLDALRVLASASELLPENYELVFCTPSDVGSLGRLGIYSRRLRVTYVSRAAVQRLQSEAHVLVAPLSHKNCSADEVQTVFSTKLLEYLVAGRPIVVFAPEGSHHAKSARSRGWGFVVSDDSPSALAAALTRVATDDDLAAGLVASALREARARSAQHHAGRLREWVGADASPDRPRRGWRAVRTCPAQPATRS
jgi:glycosyltransferase involved in cell wall biosynthesis